MRLQPETCYRALQTRDPRFDGRFFVGVRSTGIYCRPICPARTPRRENCEFLACAAAAQEAGFRPCLRCRPECSPGTPAWLGTSATVSRAMRLISEGALDDGSVGDLATRLGVGERHLRRLFAKHLGASPLSVAQTRRLLFAKKLIDETRLPMAHVALAAGFASVRRFNDAIVRTYGRRPTELRRDATNDPTGAESSEIELRLPFRPPLCWDALERFLAARATPGVEAVTPGCYRRTIAIDDLRGVVEVRPVPGESWLSARIRLPSTRPLIRVAERLRRIFDLGADPGEIADCLRLDARLERAVDSLPGVRVPGAWDGFELAVRAILGQQISVRGATTLAGRLAEAYGEPLPVEDELGRLFPTPKALAAADLTGVGLTRARAAAVSSLATAVADGTLVLDDPRGLEETVARLSELPGVGEWTAQYIAMRALREPDAFPSSDLGLRRALGNGGGPVSGRELERVAEAWRPWRAYAAMYLWMSGSDGDGTTQTG